MSNDRHLGRPPNHLRAWREFRGLTQAQLAKIIGTEGSVISLLESGDRAASDKWLRRLAEALEISPGLLLDFEPASLDAAMLEFWARVRDPERRHGLLSSDDLRDAGPVAKWPRARTRADDLDVPDARVDPGFDIPEMWSRIADEHKAAALAALKALIPRH